MPVGFSYESFKMTYVVTHQYNPDWTDPVRKIVIEGKGKWPGVDRTKCRKIRENYPGWRLILVFMNPLRKLAKNSKTTYAEHARKIGWEVMTKEQVASLKADK